MSVKKIKANCLNNSQVKKQIKMLNHRLISINNILVD